MKLKDIIKHFNLINKHRFLVFKLCVKAGIPFRGLVHDLSKYSPTEFFESVKYYDGSKSPITFCKKEKGYSKAWLHHKGRNKHHFEYWIDFTAPDPMPVIPYKYTVEMICDTLAAGMTYKKKDWYSGYQLEYFNGRKDKKFINAKIVKVLEETYKQVADNGIDKTIKKQNLKSIYNKHVNKN